MPLPIWWLSLVGQGFYAGEFFAFQEFEAGAAACRDMGDFVGYSCLVDGAYAVAAADDADGCGVCGDCLSDGVGADGEGGEFEDAGGAVPEDGLGFGDLICDERDCPGTDVQPLPFCGEVFGGIPRVESWRSVRSRRRGCYRLEEGA